MITHFMSFNQLVKDLHEDATSVSVVSSEDSLSYVGPGLSVSSISVYSADIN